MRHNHRRGAHYGDRISQFVRDSMTSDFARETGSRMKAFITRKPILSTCLGAAAGFMVALLIRRGKS